MPATILCLTGQRECIQTMWNRNDLCHAQLGPLFPYWKMPVILLDSPYTITLRALMNENKVEKWEQSGFPLIFPPKIIKIYRQTWIDMFPLPPLFCCKCLIARSCPVINSCFVSLCMYKGYCSLGGDGNTRFRACQLSPCSWVLASANFSVWFITW